MTMHVCVPVGIKPTSAYEGTCILLHSKRSKPHACYGHLLWPSSGRCFMKDILQRHQNQVHWF